MYFLKFFLASLRLKNKCENLVVLFAHCILFAAFPLCFRFILSCCLLSSFQYFPLNYIINVLIFQYRAHVFANFSVSKELNDVLWFCKSCFERVFCKYDICLGMSICSFVLAMVVTYNRFGETFARQWALFFILFWETTITIE